MGGWHGIPHVSPPLHYNDVMVTTFEKGEKVALLRVLTLKKYVTPVVTPVSVKVARLGVFIILELNPTVKAASVAR